MELHPAIQAAFLIVVGGLAAVAVVWFYAAFGAWMDDAYENGRWAWFALLLLFTFPASLIAWLIVRAVKNRQRLAT